jgi:hypothetical protein
MSPTRSDAIERSPPGVEMAVSGEAQTHVGQPTGQVLPDEKSTHWKVGVRLPGTSQQNCAPCAQQMFPQQNSVLVHETGTGVGLPGDGGSGDTQRGEPH